MTATPHAAGPGQMPGSDHRERPGAFAYVLPLRMQRDDGLREELRRYLTQLSKWCDDVIVVDASPPAVFDDNGRAWRGLARHVRPSPGHASLMGKVTGVLTGLELATHERVVIADDDVRYGGPELQRVVGLLADHDVVRPQNYFDPLPWHALWDTPRTLLNRALGADFPGTLGVRRSTLEASGGYDGDVLFENLELIRTVRAQGGRVVSPLDLYVRRLPPTAQHFIGQRVRQAYDDFAIPVRLATWLSIVPALAICTAQRAFAVPVALALGTAVIAEYGRRRCHGRAVFPAAAALLAPAWLLERGVCAWLAVGQRVRLGGVRYGDSVIPVAAHSLRTLRRRATHAKSPQPPRAAPHPS